MKYQVVFFPDPYDIGIREVEFAGTEEALEAIVLDRFQQSGPCAYGMYEKCAKGWKALPRQCYYEINKKLGRF